MSLKDRDFYKRLGLRVASLRRRCDMTQTQLAETLGCSQQQVVSFEKARVKVPASALPRLARIFGVSMEELMGAESGPAAKRGPASKLEQQLEQVSLLPRSKQRFVSEMIETVLRQAG